MEGHNFINHGICTTSTTTTTTTTTIIIIVVVIILWVMTMDWLSVAEQNRVNRLAE